ncbi:hypothetical protein [Marivirga harenae]|uniref:hypothetical protein n=1 Tax=Marivirga harenae TaxID=2010992 RepID=UPI0026E01F65|nr:hypothetical protein [Marivirga harenae]WKV11412.1 hypothetical protein Q3Y49_14485 [Marivirga harenae]
MIRIINSADIHHRLRFKSLISLYHQARDKRKVLKAGLNEIRISEIFFFDLGKDLGRMKLYLI